jgi:hypothetical protein
VIAPFSFQKFNFDVKVYSPYFSNLLCERGERFAHFNKKRKEKTSSSVQAWDVLFRGLVC